MFGRLESRTSLSMVNFLGNFKTNFLQLHLEFGRKNVAQTFRALADGPGGWFRRIKQDDVTHIFSRIDVDKSKDQPNHDSDRFDTSEVNIGFRRDLAFLKAIRVSEGS